MSIQVEDYFARETFQKMKRSPTNRKPRSW